MRGSCGSDPRGKLPFEKPPTTYDQQIDLLERRGLVIPDRSAAADFLRDVNYYRAAAYWLPFESNHATHELHPGTNFEDIKARYEFDRELRWLLLDAIGQIEVALRAQWAYQMAHRHGPHSHLDPGLARNGAFFCSNLEQLDAEVKRSKEKFIQHHEAKYLEQLPPVWVVCEVMSLGLLSKWYGNLRPGATRRAIAGRFEVDDEVLESWLRHLTGVRNLCAHHSRLWNREFTVIPKAVKRQTGGPADHWAAGSRGIYNTFLVMFHILRCLANQGEGSLRIKRHILDNAPLSKSMGFPDGWTSLEMWSLTSSRAG